MSVRVGRLKEGAQYEISFETYGKKSGATIIYVVWVGKAKNSVEMPPIFASKGFAKHAHTAPPSALFHRVEVRVDVPNDGGGTLVFEGLKAPKGKTRKDTREVSEDETYFAEIEP